MKIIEFIEELKKEYVADCIVRENGTLLLNPSNIPKCKHMIFQPLKDEYIKEFIIPSFQGLAFPSEYSELLKNYNGANLFSIKITSGEFSIAHSMLVFLGLPLTKPFNRPINMEEPFDIRIENLARHKSIPKEWVKCAIWTEIKNIGKGQPTDIFVDSITNKVYACAKNQHNILYSWNNIDECFCDIVKTFKSLEDEYFID